MTATTEPVQTTSVEAVETAETPKRRGRKQREQSAEEIRSILDEVISGRVNPDVVAGLSNDQRVELERGIAKELYDQHRNIQFQRSDFHKHELPIFYEWRAFVAMEKVNELRDKAQEARSPNESKAAAKKLEKLLSKAAELAQQLQDKGVEIDNLDIKSMLGDLIG